MVTRYRDDAGRVQRRSLMVPEQHQLRIARSTLRMSEAGALIMGGPNHSESREIITRLTGQTNFK